MDTIGYHRLMDRAESTLEVLTTLRERMPFGGAEYRRLGDAIHFVESQNRELKRLVSQVRLEQRQRADILKILVRDE